MTLNQLGQIAIAVSNTDAAEAFYGGVLGLRKLYRYGDLCFFDCAGVRLMLSPPENGATVEAGQGAIYFRVPDLLLATAELSARGADIVSQPHLTAPGSPTTTHPARSSSQAPPTASTPRSPAPRNSACAALPASTSAARSTHH